MLQCWNLSSDLRPSFSNIVTKLETLLQTSEEYLDMSEQSETEFMTRSEPLCEEERVSICPGDWQGPGLLYQDDQYLEPLAVDKTRARQTTAFPNLSYQTQLFRGDQD